jgi:trk system potassium uptake protein TrkH
LASTGLLILLPAALLLALEWSVSFAELSVKGKLLAAVFHSVSMRTGGFNTVDVGKFGAAAMWLTSLVMLIGAGPVSTAGGVRVTSAAAAWAFLRAEVRGRRASLFDRVLPDATVRRALAVILVSTLFVLAMTALLLSEERYAPLAALFEVCSAFATCGLSSGVTAQLSSFGKGVLIVTMLIGRVGPLTFVLALFVARGPRRAELAEERVLLG